MDNKKKVLLTGAALVALSSVAVQDAQAAANTTAIQAHAQIVAAIVVAPVATLEFGTFSHGGVAGTVVVPPVAAPSVTGSIDHLGASNARVPGSFSMIAALVPVVVTVGATATITHSTNVAETMTINAFNIDTDAGGISEVVTNTAATNTYNIGATLNVAGTEIAGTYSGSFTVTAAYQ